MERTNCQIVLLADEGPDQMRKVLRRFRADGLDGVTPRKAPGRALQVTPDSLAELKRVIDLDPHNPGIHTPQGSRLLRQLLTELRGQLVLVYTPAYDPESNRIEWLWRSFRRSVTHNHTREIFSPPLEDADAWASAISPMDVLRQIGSLFADMVDPHSAAVHRTCRLNTREAFRSDKPGFGCCDRTRVSAVSASVAVRMPTRFLAVFAPLYWIGLVSNLVEAAVDTTLPPLQLAAAAIIFGIPYAITARLSVLLLGPTSSAGFHTRTPASARPRSGICLCGWRASTRRR